MQYREIAPTAAAAGHIECLWLFTVDDPCDDGSSHVIVPDGAVSIALIFLPAGQVFASFVGPSVTAHKVDLISGATYGGVRIRPGAAGSVLGRDVAQYVNAFGPAVQPRPAVLDTLQAQLPQIASSDDMEMILNATAITVCEMSGPIDRPVCNLAAAIVKSGGTAPLGLLMTNAGISERQMRRRFRHQCGLSPKAFARLRRVRTACAELLSQDIARIAETSALTGFADQSHMSREFQDVFSGSVVLVEQYLRQIRHGGML